MSVVNMPSARAARIRSSNSSVISPPTLSGRLTRGP